MKKFKAGNIISHIYLIILTFISIFPLVWIIISSLKGKGELTGNPTAFWPKTWTFDYYAHVINDLKFFVNIKNSVIISLVTTLIAITVRAGGLWNRQVLYAAGIGHVQGAGDHLHISAHPSGHSLLRGYGKAGAY